MRKREAQVAAARKRGLHASRRHGWRQKLREYLWPSMGLKAWFAWVGLSLLRQAHQPRVMALGFGIGVWVSFFPILGTHMFISAALCWLLRGNLLAAILGTWFGNPWTLPLMWAASHKLGLRLLGESAMAGHADFRHIELSTLLQNLEVLGRDVLWPTMVGGALLGLPFAVLAYSLAFWQVRVWAGRRG